MNLQQAWTTAQESLGLQITHPSLSFNICFTPRNTMMWGKNEMSLQGTSMAFSDSEWDIARTNMNSTTALWWLNKGISVRRNMWEDATFIQMDSKGDYIWHEKGKCHGTIVNRWIRDTDHLHNDWEVIEDIVPGVTELTYAQMRHYYDKGIAVRRKAWGPNVRIEFIHSFMRLVANQVFTKEIYTFSQREISSNDWILFVPDDSTKPAISHEYFAALEKMNRGVRMTRKKWTGLFAAMWLGEVRVVETITCLIKANLEITREDKLAEDWVELAEDSFAEMKHKFLDRGIPIRHGSWPTDTHLMRHVTGKIIMVKYWGVFENAEYEIPTAIWAASGWEKYTPTMNAPEVISRNYEDALNHMKRGTPMRCSYWHKDFYAVVENGLPVMKSKTGEVVNMKVTVDEKQCFDWVKYTGALSKAGGRSFQQIYPELTSKKCAYRANHPSFPGPSYIYIHEAETYMSTGEGDLGVRYLLTQEDRHAYDWFITSVSYPVPSDSFKRAMGWFEVGLCIRNNEMPENQYYIWTPGHVHLFSTHEKSEVSWRVYFLLPDGLHTGWANFGHAFTWLNLGKKVRRRVWKEDVWLELSADGKYAKVEMKSSTAMKVGEYIFSLEDQVACDWERTPPVRHPSFEQVTTGFITRHIKQKPEFPLKVTVTDNRDQRVVDEYQCDSVTTHYGLDIEATEGPSLLTFLTLQKPAT